MPLFTGADSVGDCAQGKLYTTTTTQQIVAHGFKAVSTIRRSQRMRMCICSSMIWLSSYVTFHSTISVGHTLRGQMHGMQFSQKKKVMVVQC